MVVRFSSYSISVSLLCCDNRFISLACLKPRSQAVSGFRMTGETLATSSRVSEEAPAFAAFETSTFSVIVSSAVLPPGKIGLGGANML